MGSFRCVFSAASTKDEFVPSAAAAAAGASATSKDAQRTKRTARGTARGAADVIMAMR
uniref:Uncharacterized protein n=1 Tax=Arundo donax TaxID=35708 RepID=A0A0A9CCH4_ARUDO